MILEYNVACSITVVILGTQHYIGWFFERNLASGMKLLVNIFQAILIDMSVDLGRGDV